jgi:hypothetical protein
VLAVVVPIYGLTTLLAVGTAGKIGNLFSAATVGLLLLAALVLNLSMLPYPIWFKIVTPIALLAAILLGIAWSRPRREVSIEAEE